MSIKRELFKRKYYVAQREKGKLVSRIKWSPKTFTLNEAKRNFKHNGHINRFIFRKVRTNVIEVTDYTGRSKPVKSKTRLKQFVATIFNKGRPTEITVRSIAKEPKGKFTPSEIKRVIDTALRNIGGRFGTDSTRQEGLTVLESNSDLTIKRGFIFVSAR